jgi:hypothetical protein
MSKVLEFQSTRLVCAKITFFGSRGSPVQIRPPRPVSTSLSQHLQQNENLGSGSASDREWSRLRTKKRDHSARFYPRTNCQSSTRGAP